MKRMRLEGASSFQSLGVVDWRPSRSTTVPLFLPLLLSAALNSLAEGLHATARKANVRKPISRRICFSSLQDRQGAGPSSLNRDERDPGLWNKRYQSPHTSVS